MTMIVMIVMILVHHFICSLQSGAKAVLSLLAAVEKLG